MSKQIDLEKLLARASGLPDSDGAIGPTWCTPPEVIELLDHIASLDKDAARYRWLKNQMLGVDFDWCESGITALSFEMPEGCAYGGDCDQNIDKAMEASNAKAD